MSVLAQSNLSGVLKSLDSLSERIKKNVLQNAIRMAQKSSTLNAAKTAAPTGRTGALKASIVVKQNRGALKRGYVRYDVITGAAGAGGVKDAWYAHIVEGGSGKYYKGVPRRNGMAPANRSVKRRYVLRAKNKYGKELSQKDKRMITMNPALAHITNYKVYDKRSKIDRVIQRIRWHDGITPRRFVQSAGQVMVTKSKDIALSIIKDKLKRMGRD